MNDPALSVASKKKRAKSNQSERARQLSHQASLPFSPLLLSSSPLFSLSLLPWMHVNDASYIRICTFTRCSLHSLLVWILTAHKSATSSSCAPSEERVIFTLAAHTSLNPSRVDHYIFTLPRPLAGASCVLFFLSFCFFLFAPLRVSPSVSRVSCSSFSSSASTVQVSKWRATDALFFSSRFTQQSFLFVSLVILSLCPSTFFSGRLFSFSCIRCIREAYSSSLSLLTFSCFLSLSTFFYPCPTLFASL